MKVFFSATLTALGLLVVYWAGFFNHPESLVGIAIVIGGELLALIGASVASRDDIWTASFGTRWQPKREKEWTTGRVLYTICLIAFFPLMIEGLLNHNLYYSIPFFLGVAYSARGVMFVPD